MPLSTHGLPVKTNSTDKESARNHSGPFEARLNERIICIVAGFLRMCLRKSRLGRISSMILNSIPHKVTSADAGSL